MGIAEWILIIFVIIVLLTYINVAMIVRINIRADLYFKNKTKITNDKEISKNEDLATLKSDRKALKKLIGKIYYRCNPYLYGLMRYINILTGRIPNAKIRRFLYRFIFGMKLTKKSVIYGGSEFRSPWNIKISNCVISNYCIFDGRSGITVGNNVVFGVGVHMWTEEHAVNDPLFRVLPENKQPIVIDDYAWICSDSTILPGVHVGKGAVIASRACVTKNCEPYGIYAGVPARKIGERNENLEYLLNGNPTWHFY